MQNIERLISVFSKTDFSLVKEIILVDVDLKSLRKIFNNPIHDIDLFYVYPIDEKTALKLQKIIQFEYDFDNYVYQLDCFTNGPMK